MSVRLLFHALPCVGWVVPLKASKWNKKKSNISLHKTRTFSPCAQSEIKPASFPLGRGVGALLAQTLTLQKLFKTSVNQTAQRTAREKKSILVVQFFFLFFSLFQITHLSSQASARTKAKSLLYLLPRTSTRRC